jgi:hypothetical protein
MRWTSTAMLAAALASTAAGCASPARGLPPGFMAGPLAEAAEPAVGEQELPPVEVKGLRHGEDAQVGPNRQPEWTTRRRFATSRVYVLAPWQFEAESWYRARYENNDSEELRLQQELGVGLPYRFQLDYYQNFTDAPGNGVQDNGPQVEARWALADWGEIPLNPTLYGEYRWNYFDADKVEAKLLLGQTVTPGVHAAANLIWEQETSGGRATELGASAAISWSVIDKRLGIGAEYKSARETASGFRDDPEWSHQAGPSLQLRFTDSTHLDICPMFGLNKAAHDVELFVVFGFDFGGGSNDPAGHAPTSTKSQ